MSSRDRALALDAADPLAGFRDRVVVADQELLYLDGNSLGRLPHATRDRLRTHVEDEWGGGAGPRLARLGRPARAGRRRARGRPARARRPARRWSATTPRTNLFKLAVAALRATGRTVVVTDDDNFPTDRHVLHGVADLLGGERAGRAHRPRRRPRPRRRARGGARRRRAGLVLAHRLPLGRARPGRRGRRAGPRRRGAHAVGPVAQRRRRAGRPVDRRPRRRLLLQVRQRRAGRARLAVGAQRPRARQPGRGLVRGGRPVRDGRPLRARPRRAALPHRHTAGRRACSPCGRACGCWPRPGCRGCAPRARP